MRILATTLSAAALLVAGHALSVDLKNEDNKKYDIKLHMGTTTKELAIDPKATKTTVCDDCKVEAIGIGTVEAKGSKIVTIKDGKITVN